MPIPPILTLNGFDGATDRQVHELSAGTTPSQIGSNISGTANWPLSSGTRYNHNGFAKTFKNERYCIVKAAGNLASIRRENEGGSGNWGQVGVSTTTVSNDDCSGLHIVKDSSNNDIALVTVVANNLSQIEVGVSNTGQSGSWTWTTIATTNAININSTVVVFRNRLYFAINISRVLEVDPIALTATEIVAPWTLSNFGQVDMCVAFDTLYAVSANGYGFSNSWTLYQFTGGSFSVVQAIMSNSTGSVGIGAASGKNCIWTDNTNLYLLASTALDDTGSVTNAGSTCYRGVPIGGGMYTWTQDDDTVPSGIRVGTARGAAGANDRWSIYVDNDTDPTNPSYYLIVAEGAAPGTGHAIYRWEGFGNTMGLGATTGEIGPGSSVSTTFALPEVKHGGAEAISQPSASYPEIEDDEVVSGAYRLYYRVWGAETGLTGRVYFSTEQGPPDTLATLVGGGTSFGPVAGDAGVSLRQVDIDLGLSGITGPDNSTWMIKLE